MYYINAIKLHPKAWLKVHRSGGYRSISSDKKGFFNC